MAACNSQRVLIVLVVLLAIVAVIAVGMLVWRETREEEKLKLTSENLQKVYSNHFRTDEQQKFFEQKYMEGIANRTVVTDKIPSIDNTTCIFDCNNREFGQRRRKRQAEDRTSINHGRKKWQMQGGATTNHGRIKRQGQGRARARHGCCESTVGFVSPDNKKNIYGQNRKLVQLTDLKQRFAQHKCQSVDRCMGCVCSQEGNLHTAVVVKTSVSVAEYVDDTETDFFFFDGCCICVNN